mmetsp:Transcript_37378/g.120148  ORF Transcript_37378/g.120148 Transcript_37378/m.120148 type:complete len:210 (+) Transcript_37378:201-830(+)
MPSQSCWRVACWSACRATTHGRSALTLRSSPASASRAFFPFAVSWAAASLPASTSCCPSSTCSGASCSRGSCTSPRRCGSAPRGTASPSARRSKRCCSSAFSSTAWHGCIRRCSAFSRLWRPQPPWRAWRSAAALGLSASSSGRGQKSRTPLKTVVIAAKGVEVRIRPAAEVAAEMMAAVPVAASAAAGAGEAMRAAAALAPMAPPATA